MDNGTNSTGGFAFVSDLMGPGYVAFALIFVIFVLIPTTVLNLVIVIFLCVDKTTARFMRLVLANIPLACIIVASGLTMNMITGLHLNLSNELPPPNALCRFITVVIAFGGIARLLFMAAFAVTIFLIVKFQKCTKQCYLACACVIGLWVLTVIGTAPLASDEIVHAFFSDNVSCGPAPIGLGSYLYVSLYLLLFGIGTFTTTIVFLTLTVCYIRNNSVTDLDMKKAMLKLGFFLLLGNCINILGQIVPPLIATFLVTPDNAENMNFGPGNVSLIYFSYSMITLSLIPPPILVLVYFKPILCTVRKWVECCGKPSIQQTRKSSQVLSSHVILDDPPTTNQV